MLRIISHIERLLLIHDCVIVPGFGGFVSQSVPAFWKKEEHLFVPPRKEIGFNATLHHSDGLLAESYMQLYNIDYSKAQQMLNEDVEDMKKDLKRYHKLSMGVIGTITSGTEGQILFTPSGTKLFSVGSYGLQDLHMLPLSSIMPAENVIKEQQEDLAPARKDTLYIPVSRKLIRLIASTAAAIAAFLIISTPIVDVNRETYKASFIPYDVVKPVVTPAVSTNVPVNKQVVPPEGPTSKVKTASARPATPETPSSQPKATTKKVAASAPVIKKVKNQQPQIDSDRNAKMYHAVIASFPNKEQADKYIQNIDRKQFSSANVVVKNNKYRVYAQRFSNRKEANDYIDGLHKNTKYKDAWLFICR